MEKFAHGPNKLTPPLWEGVASTEEFTAPEFLELRDGDHSPDEGCCG